MKSAVLLFALALLTSWGGAAEPAADTGTKRAGPVTTLLYGSPYAPTHPFSRADRTWMNWVENRSGGTLRIRPLWSGSLVSSDQSIEELRHGVADIALITPIYVRGGAQLIRVQSGFYAGVRTFEQQVALYRCMARAEPEFGRELRGLVVLAIQGGTLPGVLMRSRPVHTLDDLQGQRLRAPSELLSVLRDLGADPVNMPMGDVYSALAKGVLDGVVAPTDTLRSMHFSEVAHYFTRLQVPRGAYPARAMNLKRWNTLDSSQQQVLRESQLIWEEALTRETRAAVGAGEAQGLLDKVTFIDVAPEQQKRFDELYQLDAERNARSLLSAGIDGPAVLHRAQTWVAGLGDSKIPNCDNNP